MTDEKVAMDKVDAEEPSSTAHSVGGRVTPQSMREQDLDEKRGPVRSAMTEDDLKIESEEAERLLA